MNGTIWQRAMAIAKKMRLKRIVIGFFVFLIVFGVVGYFALPGIIRSQAEKILTKELHRPVTIEKITVSPYWLAVTVHKFKLMEPDGQTVFVSFDRFRVSLSPESVLRLAPVIRRVKLVNPYIHVSRNSTGKFNFNDFLARQPKEESSSPLSGRFRIQNIRIEGGTFLYDDAYDVQPLHASLKQFELNVKGLVVNLNAREVDIDEITSNNAAYFAKTLKRRERVASVAKKEASPASQTASLKRSGKKSTKNEEKPFDVSIGKIDIDNWAAKLEDHHLKTPVTTTVSRISLDAKNLSSNLSNKNSFHLNAAVNAKGKLNVKGAVSISPLIADVKLSIKDINIAGLQPYFADKINLLVSSANLSSNATVKLKQDKTGATTGNIAGDIALNDVMTLDKVNEKRLMHWKSLSLNGIDIQIAPLAIVVNDIALNDYFMRITVNEKGRFNLQDIVPDPEPAPSTTTSASPTIAATHEGTRAQETEAVGTSGPLAAPPVTARPVQASPTALLPPIKINKVTLENGKIRFRDSYIKPNYKATLTDFGGTITGLSSDANTNASINLHGKVNNAPLMVYGDINPLKDELYLDLHAEVHGIELSPLSAYASKYTGYGIEKGQLSFEVAYKVENRELTANNRLILDQLTFNEDTQNETAEKLPVQLAVSLLRDSDGVIDIELPISGSLNDPEFSVGSIIGKAFVNMMGKAITSPFALLGSLFGDHEDLGWLEFDAGQSAIPAQQEEKLNTLAEALKQRPELKLEVTGLADPDTDKAGLAHATLQRKLRAAKIKNMGEKGKNLAPNKVEITKTEYPILIRQVYRSENLLSLRALAGKMSVTEMEQSLLQKVKVGPEELNALATQRAVSTKEWLMSKGQVQGARVYIRSGRLADKEDDKADGKAKFSRVEFAIK